MKYLRTIKEQLVHNWLFLRAFIRKLPNKLAISLCLAGFIGLVLCGTLMFAPEKIEIVNAVNEPVAVETKIKAMGHSEPTRLRIPSLKVDASFITLGLKKDGSMQTPSDGDTVGWYKYAPTPGELGPAVVAGHVDTKAGPAVFAKLNVLKPGETFEIDRADGTTAKFIVNEVKQFSQSDFPTEEVYGSIEHAGIRLITCGGVFNQTTKRYSHNTVVFGSLAAE